MMSWNSFQIATYHRRTIWMVEDSPERTSVNELRLERSRRVRALPCVGRTIYLDNLVVIYDFAVMMRE